MKFIAQTGYPTQKVSVSYSEAVLPKTNMTGGEIR